MLWFRSVQEELWLQRISPQTCIIPKISPWKINVEEFKSFQPLEMFSVTYLWMRWPFEHYYWIVLKIYWALNKNKAHWERNIKWVPRKRDGGGETACRKAVAWAGSCMSRLSFKLDTTQFSETLLLRNVNTLGNLRP